MWYNIKAFRKEEEMEKEIIVPQLDVRKRLLRSQQEEKVKTERELLLEEYTAFFKENISSVVDIESKNYTALEIANDEGLNVTFGLKKENNSLNFNVCNIGLIEALMADSAKLKRVNLIHAVLPFEDSSLLLKYLVDIPTISEAQTRVALGLYGTKEDADYDYNDRVIREMFRRLDFSDFKGVEKSGVSMKLVWSTYQKNMRMKH